MSTDPGTNGGLGCGGALIILLALGIVFGAAGLGSDQVSHDCGGHVASCIESTEP